MRLPSLVRPLYLLTVFCVGVPALSLLAYTPEHTFVASPNELRLDAVIGTPVNGAFTVYPGLGDFSYSSYYDITIGYTHSDHCTARDPNTEACTGGYDYGAWGTDGLLCEYVRLTPDLGENFTLQDVVDTEDIVGVELKVPCVEGTCLNDNVLPFPPELLGRELVCELRAGEREQVSRIQPTTAYAQGTDDTVRIVATIRETPVGPGATLTLPAEDRYDGVRGVASSGPNPERGIAGEDTFTFKVVYTDSDNTAPQSIRVDGAVTFSMAADAGAVDSTLRDGQYDNGEQYVAADTLPQGHHAYSFVAETADGDVPLISTPGGEPLMVTAGYSSVAFLPGLQASRLFEEGLVFEDKLWEPNRDADARSLAMDSDGTGANPDIYTKPGPDGALDEAFGLTTNIYKAFLNDLAEWKEDDGVIADYAVLPYDWRLAFGAVLGGGSIEDGKLYYDASYATDTPYIFSELERLVEGSDTGRVVLVGHSMGGLLIKKLLADLEDNPAHPYRHLLGKIDTVVLVASPQLGTPKAVASLLHGFGQELDIPPFGIPNFATDDTLREIAHDMPSGYTLVPSDMYFDRVRDVDEDGAELPSTTILRGRGAGPVDSYDEMREFFATDFGDASGDIEVPLQPRSDFLDDAHALHARLDGWYPPDLDGNGTPDFRVVQIAGWGITDTVSGIEYVQARRVTECPPSVSGTCFENYLRPEPVFTTDGDGTVVVPSAVSIGETSSDDGNVETWYVDMYQYNLRNIDRSHASILEVPDVRTAIKDTFTDTDVDGTYLHTTSDNLTVPDDLLRIALHSPVALTLTDTDGNVVRMVTEDGGTYSDEGIPNSYLFRFGESTYAGVPLYGGPLTLTLQGTGDGVFTLKLVEEHGGVVAGTRTFTEIPVTPALSGTMTLSALGNIEELVLDTDGDGVEDTTVRADETPARDVTYQDLIDAIQILKVPAKIPLLATARISERFYEQGRRHLAIATLRILEEQVTFWSSPKRPVKLRLEEEDALALKKIIKELILSL